MQTFNYPILGLTATPLCSNPKGTLNNYYDDLIMPIDTPELILSGHIVGSKTYSIEHDWTGLKKTAKGDYSEASQMLHFGKKKFMEGIVKHWHTYAAGKSSIIYCVNVEHSIDTCERFRESGITCEHMDGTMSQDERSGILQRSRSGETQVICNVHLLTTGNDEKHIECIGFNRKVGLISTAIQIGGRGARSHRFPDGRRKRNFICLDMGANHEKHGTFGSRIDWKAIFQKPETAKSDVDENEKSTLVCVSCAGVNAKRLADCLYCGESLEKSKKKNRSFSQLCAPDPKILEEIKQKRIDDMPPDLRGLTPGQMTKDQLWRFCQHMNYKPSYFHIMINKRKGRR
jgi:superfamily II DNA or RNA helicase